MSTKAIEALKEAREAVVAWSDYVPEYFRQKHDLAGDLAKIDEALADLEAQGGQAGEPAAWINWSAMTGEPRLGWQCESEIASEPLYRRAKPKHHITYVCTACNFSLERQE